MNRCEIVADLLPLYIDKACSEDSVLYITEHLNECSCCRELLEMMKKETLAENKTEESVIELKRIEPLAKFKRKNRIKNVLVITVILFLLVAIAYLSCELVHKSMLHYEEELICDSTYIALERVMEVISKRYGTDTLQLYVDMMNQNAQDSALLMINEKNLRLALIDNSKGDKYDICIKQRNGSMNITIDKEKTEDKGEIPYNDLYMYMISGDFSEKEILRFGTMSKDMVERMEKVYIYVSKKGLISLKEYEGDVPDIVACICVYTEDDEAQEYISRVDIIGEKTIVEKKGYRVRCVVFIP